jgi:hypothetical protein
MRCVPAVHCGIIRWLWLMTRSSARQAGSNSALVLALVMWPDQASMAGLLMPDRLPESSVSAALLPKMSAYSWPGLWVPW